MGGDFAPEAAAQGAVLALEATGPDSRIGLFGHESKINAVLETSGCSAARSDTSPAAEGKPTVGHHTTAIQAKSR